ncbi:hypothetical protein MUP77_19170, partial [Candidatus Bathyarchaeota archaeon]|nr:hypothetical protein [Candidatus Bathyarchaeota archaeon]
MGITEFFKEKKEDFSKIFLPLMKAKCNEEERKMWYTGSLTLFGFTLTTLSIIIGFYKPNLNEAVSIISGTSISLFLYFLGYYIAIESESFWQISVAGLVHYLGTLVLILSFTIFLNNLGILQTVIYLPIAVFTVLTIVLFTGSIRFFRFYDK